MDGKVKRKMIKSKSSNSALFQKVERRNKPKSHGRIEPQIIKKRGVYVENKPNEMSIDIQETQKIRKHPPRRPGKKRFLASVLSILSKSSTATQYPEKGIPRPKKKILNNTEMLNLKLQETRPIEQDKININIDKEKEKKRKKFRSKILNNNTDYVDKLEVIQRTKEIRFSSIESSKEDINTNQVKDKGKPNIVKEISEGRKLEKIKIDKDPSTLVAEVHKKDKKIYNFFVDLLEKSFSMYSLEDKEKHNTSVTSSKVVFEIDEAVAKKLNVANPITFDDVTQKPSHNNVSNESTKILDYLIEQPSFSRQNYNKTTAKKRKLKSESFSHTKRHTPKLPATHSAIAPNKTTPRTSKKRDLLNILKQELAIDNQTYEEPKNLYDALKAMARSKRKHQKTLRFANMKKNNANSRDDCMLKRKNIKPTSSFQYKKLANTKTADAVKLPKKTKLPENEYIPSVHSIKVYGFDYNTIPCKFKTKHKKQVSLPYHSSSSDFNFDF